MEFVDFRSQARSPDIATLFPGWRRGETVAFLAPHDDDVVLGAGYLVQAVRRAGGLVRIFIFCKGDAGYSTLAAKRTIVRTRHKEALLSYGTLGVRPSAIHFFGLPDLSVMTYVNRCVFKRKGLVDDLIRLFRRHKVSRAVFSSPHFENWDHTAVYNIGMYVAPQAGDPVLADLGKPFPVRSSLVYSVWGDFGPASTDAGPLVADVGVLAGEKEERLVRKALRAFASQAEIMENTVARHRDSRSGPGGYLELYQRPHLREPIDYRPYFEFTKRGRHVRHRH